MRSTPERSGVGYPYGGTRYSWGSTPTDRRFTGQRSEEATLGSLYDYGARMYSPALARFISADTMVPSAGDPQSLNRYAYAGNNPVKYTDPTGHMEACEANNCGTGKWLPPPPPILVGDPEEIAEAQVMLIHAKHYGPQTRRLVDTIENSRMRVRVVRDEAFWIVDPINGVFDLGDLNGLREDLYNPLPPANVLLHELVEQYHYQVNKKAYPKDYPAVHSLAVDAENLANSERYADCPAGEAPVRDIKGDGGEADAWRTRVVRKWVTYYTTYPEIGGRNKAVVTYDFDTHVWTTEWRQR